MSFKDELDKKIKMEEVGYREQIFSGESPEFMRGFETGRLMALYEINNLFGELVNEN